MCQEFVNLYVVSVASEHTIYKSIFEILNPFQVHFFVLNQISFGYKN